MSTPSSASSSHQTRDRVFVSYSRLDKEWLDKLREFLHPDIRNGRVDYRDDRNLTPGENWYEELVEYIAHARVAVLLVSPNLLASSFVMEKELPLILEAEAQGLTILWVPLSGTFYGPNAPTGAERLTPYQAAWDPNQPLDALPEGDRKQHLLDLCKLIGKLVGVLRPPNNLPFTPLGDLLKGRGDDLVRLDNQLRLHGSSAIVQPQAVSGPGGIGKTRLAVEYARRHENHFTALLFVSAGSPSDLDANMARLCAADGALDLTEYKSASQDDQYAAVIRWLQQNKGWLLILDNVDAREAADAVKKLVAKLTGGHVLITSRIAMWSGGIPRFPLDVLSPDAAVALLIDKANSLPRTPRPDDAEQALALAEQLGYLPLALTHAAAYVGESDLAFGDYLREFDRAIQSDEEDLIEYDSNPESAKILKTVATTYFLSIDRLGPVEKAILRSACFLAPAPVPIAMFADCPDEMIALVDLWCEETGEPSDGKAVRDAIKELVRYSLIERGAGVFTIHRMERLVLAHQVHKKHGDRVPKWIEATRAVLVHYAPEETSESPATWPIWDVLRPHAEELIGSFLADKRITPHLDLMHSLGCLLFGKGLYALSLKIDLKALRVARRVGGLNGKEMADKLLNCGESLRNLDRGKSALKAFRRSLAIRENVDGADSLRVASILNYVGLAHNALEQEKESEACYRRAIAIYESQSEAADKDEIAKVLNNLAALIFGPERLQECEDLLSRAVELTEESPGHKPKPQLAIICRVQLADLLLQKGDAARAGRLFDEVVKLICLFPNEHPFHEAVLERYAAFLCRIHNLTEAKRQFSNATLSSGPRWGSDGFIDKPMGRIRGKLRIVEGVIQLDKTPVFQDSPPNLLATIRSDLNNLPIRSWSPKMIKGITVRDTEHLGFHFLVDRGSETGPLGTDQATLRPLMEFFLTAMAVDEAHQWASSDGEVPSELRGTKLGAALQQQARALVEVAYCTLSEETPVGAKFMAAIGSCRERLMAQNSGMHVEIWLTPTAAKVYVGDPVGEWARFGSKGVAHAFVVKSGWDVFWQWHIESLHFHEERTRDEFVKSLDTAFEAHVAPVIMQFVIGSKLFGPLRQIQYCMILGTWFKQKYRYHPKVAGFLETGDPNQLTPNIQTISSLSEDSETGIEEINISVSESIWQKAIDLNNEALELRNRGRPAEAKPLLREALKLDEDLRGLADPKIAHRLNNLSTVLIMLGELGEARERLAQAWLIKQNTGHDITSPRVLFVRLTLAVLESEQFAQFIGQLKSVFARQDLPDNANVVNKWDIIYFIDYLRPQLPAGSAEFLTALVAAMNDRANLPALDSYPEWCDQPPITLDSPWPAE